MSCYCRVHYSAQMSLLCIKLQNHIILLKKKSHTDALSVASWGWSACLIPLKAAKFFFSQDAKSALTTGMYQRGDPSEWSRARSCRCGDYGGPGGRGPLPDRAAVCAVTMAGRSHSGPPLPASCWWDGREPRSGGGSPAPKHCPGRRAAETAARLNCCPELPERKVCDAGGAAGGHFGRAKEPWWETDNKLGLFTLLQSWKITTLSPKETSVCHWSPKSLFYWSRKQCNTRCLLAFPRTVLHWKPFPLRLGFTSV